MHSTEQFLAALAPGENRFCFRSFRDKKGEQSEAANFYHQSLDQALPQLQQKQREGWGVYFVVNEGGGDIAHITKARALFIDMDVYKGQSASEWHLPPSAVVKREDGGGFHVYWFVQTEDLAAWQMAQKQLANHYGCDLLFDLPRVMRLPGFANLKDPQHPKLYLAEYLSPQTRYGQLEHALVGLEPLPAELSRPPIAPIRGADQFSESDGTINRAISYLRQQAPKATHGEYNNVGYIVACRVRELGVPEQYCQGLMAEHWCPRLDSFDVDQLPGIIGNAYRYSQNAAGVKNTELMGFGANPVMGIPTSAPVAPPAPVDPGMTAAISNLGYDKKNQAFNAQLFLARCYPGDVLEFCVGGYYRYTGTHWEAISEGVIAKQFLVELMQGSGFDIPSTLVGGTLSLIKKMCYTDDQFKGDQQPIVVCDNGVVDLRQMELLPHDKKYRVVGKRPFSYDPTATCPNWQHQLNWMFKGDKSSEILLQQVIAYCLMSHVTPDRIVMLIGPTKAGKGTSLRLIESLLGDGVRGYSLSEFGKAAVVYEWRDAQVVYDGDMPSSLPYHHRDEICATLKRVTGGDSVTGHQLGTAHHSLTLNCRIVLSGNSLPRLKDESGALAFRTLPIEFQNTCAGAEDKRLFQDKLKPELSGIFNWCMQQRHNVEKGEFTMGHASTELKAEISAELSVVQRFVGEGISFVPGAPICSSEQIYNSYVAWAAMARESSVMERRRFGRAFKQAVLSIIGVVYTQGRVGERNTRGYVGLVIVGAAPTPTMEVV